jgi:hypothetical protein
MKALALSLLTLLAASVAFADTAPPSTRTFANGAQVGKLCDAETSTGDCTSTDEIVLDLRGKYTVSFWGIQSTATAYTCDVIGSDLGHDGGSGEGQDLTASAITETNQAVFLEGALGYVWINCSTITGGNVTITYIAVPL